MAEISTTMTIVFAPIHEPPGDLGGGDPIRLSAITDAFCAVWRDPDTGKYHATFVPEDEWRELGIPQAIEAAMDEAAKGTSDPLSWYTVEPEETEGS